MPHRLIVFLFCLLSLAACAPPPVAPVTAWTYSDLRVLDTVPEVDLDPALDLAALYLRRQGSDLLARLELLEVVPEPGCDLRLQLSGPGAKTRSVARPPQIHVNWGRNLLPLMLTSEADISGPKAHTAW